MKHLLVCLTALALLFGCLQQATAGALYFSLDSTFEGLYTLDTSTGEATHVGISGVTSSTVGLAPSGDPDLLYGAKWAGFLHINK